MVSQMERREVLQADTDLSTVSVTVVVAVGGGSTSGTATFSSAAGIDAVVGVVVTKTSPHVADLNPPEATISGNTIGLSIHGGTGTTVTLSVSAWTH